MLDSSSSLSNLQVGLMGVLICLLDSNPNVLIISLVYLAWLMKVLKENLVQQKPTLGMQHYEAGIA